VHEGGVEPTFSPRKPSVAGVDGATTCSDAVRPPERRSLRERVKAPKVCAFAGFGSSATCRDRAAPPLDHHARPCDGLGGCERARRPVSRWRWRLAGVLARANRLPGSAIARPGRAQTRPSERSGKFNDELLARAGKTRRNEQSSMFDCELLARAGKTRRNEQSSELDCGLRAQTAPLCR
jgi:hypothetical protein